MSGHKNLPFPSCIWRVERASNMHRKISTAQDLMCYRSAMHCDIPGAASTLLSAQNQLSLLLRERRDPEPPAALTGIPAQGCARCVLSPPCSLIKQRPMASSTRENNVWTRKVLLRFVHKPLFQVHMTFPAEEKQLSFPFTLELNKEGSYPALNPDPQF